MQKIVVCTSAGGGGHMSASSALETYLKGDFQITNVCLLAEVLKSFDPVLLASMGKCEGEKMYNALTPYNQWWLLNLIYRAGRVCFAPFAPLMCKRLVAYLKEQNADMVISVIPIFNKVILQAAQELDIPCLLMPTDLDVRAFTYNIRYPHYKKFHLSLIFDDHAIKQHAYATGIGDHFVSYNGFPLRPEFFEEKNTSALKDSFNLDPSMPVIMVMMGSQGSNGLVACVQHLARLKKPAQLIVCIGKHQAIEAPLRQIALPSWVTLHVVQETNRISDYMAVSDLLISKSGTASFCEAIHMKLPVIFDGTSSALIWERFNHRFAQEHGLGMVMTSYEHMLVQIHDFIEHAEVSRLMKQNQSRLRFKETPEKIRFRIERMLRPSYQYSNLMMAYSKKSRLD